MSRVSAVLLAAGASRRFGHEEKLLAAIGGEPLAARVTRVLREAGIGEIVAVVREDCGPVAAALSGRVTRVVCAPGAVYGMGSSIAAGIAALGPAAQGNECAGALVVPGDMPGLTPALVRRLTEAFERNAAARIVYAALDGAQRNPVLWPRRLFPELAALAGETGGKAILARHPGDAVAVAATASEVADIDTPDDLARWSSSFTPGRSTF